MKRNINQDERLCRMGRFLNIRIAKEKEKKKKKTTGVRYNTHTSLWRDIWGGRKRKF